MRIQLRVESVIKFLPIDTVAVEFVSARLTPKSAEGHPTAFIGRLAASSSVYRAVSLPQWQTLCYKS